MTHQLNMDYNLLKQLKEVGFPQHEGEVGAKYWFPSEVGVSTMDYKAYEPTTDELIEELGNRLKSIHIINEGHLGYATNMDNLGNYDSFGFTPKEALIKLYIELHKK